MKIAADSSTWIAYFQGEPGSDAEDLDALMEEGRLVMPGAVLVEVLSEPKSTGPIESLILAIPVLELRDGFWHRAALLRREVLRRGFKAKLGDALIAQCCLDHDVALLTRDKDFRHFAKYGKLRLA